jgi:YtkA-like
MKKVLFSFTILVFFLVGCVSKPSHHSLGESNQSDIEVKVLAVSKVKTVGDPFVIELQIIQDQHPVDDAQDVKIDIWSGEGKDVQTIVANHKGKGVYRSEIVVYEEGEYHMLYHVTARGQHVMAETQPIEVKEDDGREGGEK